MILCTKMSNIHMEIPGNLVNDFNFSDGSEKIIRRPNVPLGSRCFPPFFKRRRSARGEPSRALPKRATQKREDWPRNSRGGNAFEVSRKKSGQPKVATENGPSTDEPTTTTVDHQKNEKILRVLQNTVYLTAQPGQEQNEPAPRGLQNEDVDQERFTNYGHSLTTTSQNYYLEISQNMTS